MWQFLQTYGIWILLGALFILMMRMHGGGMHGHGMGGGCGMGMEHDQHDEPSNTQRVVPLDDIGADAQRAVPLDGEYSDAQRRALVGEEYSDSQRGTLVRAVGSGEESAPAGQTNRHRGGC